MPVDKQARNKTVGTAAGLNTLMNRPSVWWLKVIHELYSSKVKWNWSLWGQWWWPLQGGRWWASHQLFMNATSSTQLYRTFPRCQDVSLLCPSWSWKSFSFPKVSLQYVLRWTAVTFARLMGVSYPQPVPKCHNFHPAWVKLPTQQRWCSSMLHPC